MEQISKAAPLHEQVYDILCDSLLKGDYSPGERLIEAKIAEKLGVSRAPVREAIRMLVKDGLIVQTGNFLIVYEVTLNDIVNMYQCRNSLESLAARLAAGRITKAELQLLKTNVGETRQKLNEKNTSEVVRLNTEFHNIIIQASHNEQLIQLMEGIRKKVLYMRNAVFRNYYRRDEYLDEHELIVQAIEEGNEEKAEREMSRHIENDLKALNSLYSEKTNKNS